MYSKSQSFPLEKTIKIVSTREKKIANLFNQEDPDAKLIVNHFMNTLVFILAMDKNPFISK